MNRFKRFKHKLLINQGNEQIEIFAKILKQKKEQSDNDSTDSEDSLEELAKSIKMDSLKAYLDSVLTAATKEVDNDSEEDTSIQEHVTLNKNKDIGQIKNKNLSKNYKIHQINLDEKVEEIDNFNKDLSKISKPSVESNKLIDGSSITKIVEKLPDLQDFDETVEIVDSVVIDHVSEDDKSTSSEEVTFERWTEETKVVKTKIFKDGQLVDEIIEQSTPELVGNILREKLIERHEHIKHISQDVLKRIRVKSPGQSRRESIDIDEIINQDLDGSSVIIVEPTQPSNSSVRLQSDASCDNMYYIQHQQVITPSGETISGTNKICSKCIPANSLMHEFASEFTSINSSSTSPFKSLSYTPFKSHHKCQFNHTKKKINLNKLKRFTNALNNYNHSNNKNDNSSNTTSITTTTTTTTANHNFNNNNNYRDNLQIDSNLNLNQKINKESYTNQNNNQIKISTKSFENNNNNNFDSTFNCNSTSITTANSLLNVNKSSSCFNPILSKNENINNHLNTSTNLKEQNMENNFKDSLENLYENSDDSINEQNTNKNEILISKHTPNLSTINTYFAGLKAQSLHDITSDHNQEFNSILLVKNDQEIKNNNIQQLPDKIDIKSPNPELKQLDKRNEIVKTQYETIIQSNLNDESLLNEELPEMINDEFENLDDDSKLNQSGESINTIKLEERHKSDSIISNTSDSIGSMQRFERPSKFELQKYQLEKQQLQLQQKLEQAYFYEENSSTTEFESTNEDRHLDVLDKSNDDNTLEAKLVNNQLQQSFSLSQNDKKSPQTDESKKSQILAEDRTDVSDEEVNFDSEQNIYDNNNNNNINNNQTENIVIKSSSAFSNSSSSSDNSKPRNTPLRRESFELAQRDSSTKRLSISKSSTSSSSSSFGSNQIIIKPPLNEPVNNLQSNQSKRMLSEIKPILLSSNEQPIDESVNEKTPSFIEEAKQSEQIEDVNQESDSSDTSSKTLKRNYELLRKKTNEKIIKSHSSQNNSVNEEEPEDQRSFISCHSINKSRDEETKPAANKPSRIKVVKKQKSSTNQKDTKYRSVSPGLVRGPDVIETIETTTSMSFIMNKNIKLVTEEKRQHPQSTNFIDNFSRSRHESRSDERNDSACLKSTPIPIHVHTRSKSEPKLDIQHREVKFKIAPLNRTKIEPIHINEISVPVNYDLKQQEIKPQSIMSPRSRITFHKYDSNEIIAVVNVPEAYETTTIESAVNKHQDSYHKKSNYYNKRMNKNSTLRSSMNKNHSRSEPNLSDEKSFRTKLDSWKQWPDFTVEQETDNSISNKNHNKINSTWVKEKHFTSEIKPTKSENRVIYRNSNNMDKNRNYEFEIEIEKKPVSHNLNKNNLTTTSVSIDSQPTKAKIHTDKDGRVCIQNVSFLPGNQVVIKSNFNSASNSIKQINERYSSSNMQTTTTTEHETAATRISSGYFSGDEFRSFFMNNYLDILPNNGLTSKSNLNQYSPVLSSSTKNSTSNQFNINKFLNNSNRTRVKNRDAAIDEINKLYKSIGLDDDEALLDRASARDHPTYGHINENLSGERSKRCNSYSAIPYLSSSSLRNTILDENDEDINNEPDESYYRKSIYSQITSLPDTNDEFNKRCYFKTNLNSMSASEIENEIQKNQAYLDHATIDFDREFLSSYSKMNPSYSYSRIEPDLARDDASILNPNRKRSNSLSTINNFETISNQMLILPSPTTADYLRNRTRESALINVVMNPAKTTTDFEIGQILYDDMAYRQLRKDSEAHKLSQIKATSLINNQLPNNMTNITTLPLNYNPPSKSSTFVDYYQNTFSSNNNSSSVKTVKMIKQKDASKNLFKNSNSYDNPNRYFTNSSNPEINDYYDMLNNNTNRDRNFNHK